MLHGDFILISDQFHEKICRQALVDQGKRPQAGCRLARSLDDEQRVPGGEDFHGFGQILVLCALNEMETDYVWQQKRLKHMLTNPVYKGDYYSHGTVCLVPGKPIPNRGYRDRFYIKGHHEGIIAPEEWERVQKIIERGILISYKKLSEQDREFLRGIQGGRSE